MKRIKKVRKIWKSVMRDPTWSEDGDVMWPERKFLLVLDEDTAMEISAILDVKVRKGPED